MSYLDAHHAKLRLSEDLLNHNYQTYIGLFNQSATAQMASQHQAGMGMSETRARILREGPGPSHARGAEGAEALRSTLRSAETFTMSLPMYHLVSGAAEEMPHEYPLLPQEIPSLQGILYLPEPFAELDLHGRLLHSHIVVWNPVEHKTKGGTKYGLWLSWFTDRDDTGDEVNQELLGAPHGAEFSQMGKYVLMSQHALFFNEPIPHSPDPSVIRELDKAGLPEDWRFQYLVQEETFYDGERSWNGFVPVRNDDATLSEEQWNRISAMYTFMSTQSFTSYQNTPLMKLVAFWRLCQMTLAAKEFHHPDRHLAKRLVKKSFGTNPVTVITLRRRQQSQAQEGRMVEWDHRWLRRGHWRQQWYGPHSGERYQKAIYINPTICGPEDKPLKIRPHVNVLAR